MSLPNIQDMLRAAKLVPVLTIHDAAEAPDLARALVAGGVRMLEVTLRTPAGAAAAKAIREQVPEALVGLGTVMTARDLDLARNLGVPFAFSPGATPELLDQAARLRAAGADFAFVPGVGTASELMAALARGFSTVKLFPAKQVGGIGMLKSLAGPFPEARFCPTGGISEAEIGDYLALPNVLAIGGSWLAPTEEIARGEWEAITARAKRAMAALSGKDGHGSPNN